MRLEARNEQQIDNLDGTVATSDTNCAPPLWSQGDEFRVLDRKGSSVGQMNVKRQKRLRPKHLSELFDGHS